MDPDGRFDLPSILITFFSSNDDLGKSNSMARSLYHQQYMNKAEDNQNSCFVFNVLSLVESGIFHDGGIVLSALSMFLSYNDSDSLLIVVFSEKFVVGAENEVSRISGVLEILNTTNIYSDTRKNDCFGKFLRKQRALLENEIFLNKEYNSKLVYSAFGGAKFSPPEYDVPADMMINYISEFEKYYKNYMDNLEYEY